MRTDRPNAGDGPSAARAPAPGGLRGLLRRLAAPASALRHSQRGQVLPLFVIMSVVLLGGAALLTDVAWWWTFEQRMQRAADAASLAGAIYLPGNQDLAFSTAVAEAAKNGFVHNPSASVFVIPRRDPNGDTRKLLVDIDAPVATNFARVFCWQGGPCLSSVAVGVTSAASYVLPVPMGSPENYYGVFGRLRTPSGGTTTFTPGDTGWIDLGTTKGTNNWDFTAGNVYLSDDQRATSSTDGQRQQWGFTSGISFPANLSSILGVEVNVEARTTSGSSCQVRADLSWNDGATWTTGSGVKTVPAAGLTASDPAAPYYVMGGASDLWGRGSWSAGNFTAANFRIRLENRSPAACDGTTEVDYIQVKVHFRTSTFTPDANIPDPYGNALTPRGLWGTFINQGAEKINGDAYLPKYDPRTSPNAEYDPNTYYNYTVEIPASADDNSGELWIYDPVFCATSQSGQYGTGDRWFSGTAATSAYYTLYHDDDRTPLILSDDNPIAASGSLFENIRASDESLGGPDLGSAGASTDCSVGATANQTLGRYWHNRWWQIANNLDPGTYRLHTRSTHPTDPNAMNSANGHNSFALWARATNGSPKIHGLGAMEAFTPLNGDDNATFYLAQIDAEHEGKQMVINLWDPGDTNVLPARLKFLKPTSGGYEDAEFTYTAVPVAAGHADCVSGNGIVTSVVTNTGNNSQFNGCWLEIVILLTDYDAPTPPGEPEPGWWKIQYVMEGDADDAAFDLTTWKVELRGNPVHLVQE